MRTTIGSLAVVLVVATAVAQGPVGGRLTGPGYNGSYPSDAARAVLAELVGRESTAAEAMLGPGPWTVGTLCPPIPYAPGPAEKNVHRLGQLTVKGPNLEFESPFCLWRLPVETDGDVAFVHHLVTGEDHDAIRGARSERLEAALRFLRHYGTIVRGLRVALVCEVDRVPRGGAGQPLPPASLIVYNASGKAVEVEATTTLHVGAASVDYALGNQKDQPRRIALQPGQAIERRIDLAALRFPVEGGDPVDLFAALPDGVATLRVEIELAPDARGNRGVVASIPQSLTIVREAGADGGRR